MKILPMKHVFRRGIYKVYFTLNFDENMAHMVSPRGAGKLQDSSSTMTKIVDLSLCPVQVNDRIILKSGESVEVISIFFGSAKNRATIRNLKSTQTTDIELSLLINTIDKFL